MSINEILTNIDDKLQELNKTEKIQELIYKEKNVSKDIDMAMKKMNELKKRFNQEIKIKNMKDDEIDIDVDDMIKTILEEIEEISDIEDIEEQIERYRKLKKRYLTCKKILDEMKSEKIYCDKQSSESE